jgi:hypothetical protein
MVLFNLSNPLFSYISLVMTIYQTRGIVICRTSKRANRKTVAPIKTVYSKNRYCTSMFSKIKIGGRNANQSVVAYNFE